MSFERDNIHKMAGYSYGEQPADDTVVKLNTNENPYPPSPAVQSALADFEIETLRRYPPALANEFRAAAAKLHSVTIDNIIATQCCPFVGGVSFTDCARRTAPPRVALPVSGSNHVRLSDNSAAEAAMEAVLSENGAPASEYTIY